MVFKIKKLGYLLKPGEKFVDEEECVEDDEINTYTKKEIYLTKQIEEKIRELELKPLKGDLKVNWIETLTVVGNSTPQTNTDLTLLNTQFEELAMEFVKIGLNKFKRMGIEFNRPMDFYAEMMKSDEQMSKIMRQIEHKQKIIQQNKMKLQSKKNRKMMKKMQKLSKTKKLKQLQEKNKFIKQVNYLRKHKKNNLHNDLQELIK